MISFKLFFPHLVFLQEIKFDIRFPKRGETADYKIDTVVQPDIWDDAFRHCGERSNLKYYMFNYSLILRLCFFKQFIFVFANEQYHRFFQIPLPLKGAGGCK